MPNEETTNSNLPDKIAEKPETISELAHRHLKDEKHTTSDEELRNATVEFSEDADTSDQSLFEIDNTTVTSNTVPTDDASEDRKGNDKGTPPNPYTVLNP
jgi:hypothetical protein